jgi:hypothetical protein
VRSGEKVGTTHHVHVEDSRPSVAIHVLEDPMLLQHFNVPATKVKYQKVSLTVEEKFYDTVHCIFVRESK